MPENDVRSLRPISNISPSSLTPNLSGINALVAHSSFERKNQLFVGGNNQTALIIDAETRDVVCQLTDCGDNVTSIVFHPDPSSGTVVTGAVDGMVNIYNTPVNTFTTASAPQKVSPTYSLSPYSGKCNFVSILPVGSLVSVGYADGTWALLDILEGKLLTLCPPREAVEMLCWSLHPDGMLLGGGSADGSLFIYDVCTQNLEIVIPGTGSPISAISFSENGYFVGIGGKDGSIALWDLRKIGNPKGHVVHTWTIKSGSSVSAIAFDNSVKFVASGHDSGEVCVWDVTRKLSTEGDGSLVTLESGKSSISSVSWATTGNALYSVSSHNNSVCVFIPHGMDQE